MNRLSEYLQRQKEKFLEMEQRFSIAKFEDLPELRCPCGHVRRAFTDDPDQTASIHFLEIAADSRIHYHKRTTEIYYVLEGEGTMELDGQSITLQPGIAVMIKPFCRHRASGKLKIINIPVPAFNPDDEFFD